MSSRSCVEQARHLPLHSCYGEGRPALLVAHARQPLWQANDWDAGWCVSASAVKHAGKHERQAEGGKAMYLAHIPVPGRTVWWRQAVLSDAGHAQHPAHEVSTDCGQNPCSL